jgi:hypothetical protein
MNEVTIADGDAACVLVLLGGLSAVRRRGEVVARPSDCGGAREQLSGIVSIEESDVEPSSA